MPVKDSLMAASALSHDLAIATLNRRDFEAAGVENRQPCGRDRWLMARSLGADPSADARPTEVLPDLLGPGLRVVFCGTAASAASARIGAPYAGPGNYFWQTLHDVGLTPRRIQPPEFKEVLRYGIGLTDLCKTRSGSDREIGADAFDVPALVRKLKRHQPTWLAFTSKAAARFALGRGTGYGEQPERLGGASIYALPSPSGRARRFWDPAHWQQLADLVGS